MYAACGVSLSARKLFDEIPQAYKDTVDWTALMNCFNRSDLQNETLGLFIDMRKLGVLVDDVTMVSVFSACSKLGNGRFGSQCHACMIKLAFGYSVKACNSTMDMYVKCGLIHESTRIFHEMMNERNIVSWTVRLEGAVKWEGLESARLVFDEMPERNEVAWTIMIVAYVENGSLLEAFALLKEMIFGHGLGLNFVTICSLLSACTQLGDVTMGRWIHVYALKMMDEEINVVVATALIDMYSKCGRVNSALRVFKMMPLRNVIMWNAMLNGLAMHGMGGMVLDMFDQMVKEVQPDDVTFTAILSACSHSGLIDEGRHFFYNLELMYGIRPSIEHYACIVDLLGRAGHLEEAEAIVRQMPMQPNAMVLGSLLGSCSFHNKLKLGEGLMQELLHLYPQNTEYHILLSNMYASEGNHDRADSLRGVLKVKGIRKVPGLSFIQLGGKVHQFFAGDNNYTQVKGNEMVKI